MRAPHLDSGCSEAEIYVIWRMGGVGRWIMPLLVPCISTGMMSMSIAGLN